MIHIGNFEIPTDIFVICACVVLFALQLALCTYVKRLWVRLAPAVLFTLAAVALFLVARSARDWDAFGYLLLALFALFCALSCGLAWAFWGIIRFFGRDKSERNKK